MKFKKKIFVLIGIVFMNTIVQNGISVKANPSNKVDRTIEMATQREMETLINDDNILSRTISSALKKTVAELTIDDYEKVENIIFKLEDTKFTDKDGPYILPPSIGLCKNLSILRISEEINISTIPNEIGYLKNLEVLEVGHYIKNLPETLWKLTKIKYLLIQSGYISEIPQGIEKLINLESLSIGLTNEKSTEKIPDIFGDLNKLETLQIEMRNAKAIPPSVGKLINLTSLVLRDIELEEFPEQIENLKKLSILEISNSFINKLPNFLFNMDQIENLDLSYNLITEKPKELDTMKKLKNLNLTGNFIMEEENQSQLDIPNEVYGITYELGENIYEGVIPKLGVIGESERRIRKENFESYDYVLHDKTLFDENGVAIKTGDTKANIKMKYEKDDNTFAKTIRTIDIKVVNSLKESNILGHGLFNGSLDDTLNSDKLLTKVEIVPGSNYMLGAIAHIKNEGAELIINSDLDVEINTKNVCLYEVVDNKIDKSTKTEISNVTKNKITIESNSLKKDKKYIVLYNVKAINSSENNDNKSTASIDTDSKDIKLKKTNDSIDLF